MPFIRRVTSKKWCTAVQNIEFNINISCILCVYFFVSSVQMQSPGLYIIQALFLKIFPFLKKKKNAWSQVTLEVKCAWWLAFVLHHISLFSFFFASTCRWLELFSTSFEGRFTENRLWKSGWSVQRVKHGNWRKGNIYCGRHDIIFLRAGEGGLHTFSAFINNVQGHPTRI